jgi:hypothetical protein
MVQTDQLIEDYLAALQKAAAVLPADQRGELVNDIREHIEVSLAEPSTSGEKAPAEQRVRELLDRIGTPSEIIAAIGLPGESSVRMRLNEVSAVVLLLFGGFVFVMGWFAGLALLWTSDRWKVRDKLIGTLLLPGGLFGSALVVGSVGVFSTPQTCTGVRSASNCTIGGVPVWLDLMTSVVLAVAPIATSIYLSIRAHTPAPLPFAPDR